MHYREPLPERCPPEESEEIVADRIVYRVVRNNPPIADDFKSRRAECPVTKFAVSECLARGVSVHADHSSTENVMRLPKYKKRGIVCLVKLEKGAGKIQKTGANPSHHTWWPYADYDILAHCSLQA